MTRSIHQLTAGFKQGDAISNEARAMQRIFRGWGYDSMIYCENRTVQKEIAKQVTPVHTLKEACRPDDLAVLHLSSGSISNEVFAELPCRKVIRYHNITPPSFFVGVQDTVYTSQGSGLEQVKQLANVADLNLAVSAFNAQDLTEAGYHHVEVFPLMLDLNKVRKPIGKWARQAYGEGLINIMFVGRIAGNKKIEDLLRAFSFFQKTVEPDSRLIHVGFGGFAEKYNAVLRAMMVDMKLENVEFAGGIRQKDLNGCYEVAHLFLCMSEHEGFCIPLLEAMVHDVPVMAYAAAAVPETMAGAGVLFHEKDYKAIAEMMGRLVFDQDLRRAVIRKQRERVARYESRDLAAELKAHLDPLLPP